MNNISEAELEDFKNTLSEFAGYSFYDFDLKSKKTVPKSNNLGEAYDGGRQIKVTNKKTKKTKTYCVCPGDDWIMDFDKDLKAGIYS